MKKITMFLSAACILLCSYGQQNELKEGNGIVNFISNAPLEIIKASSNQLKGILDLSNKTFAFSFPVNSFNGFNSPLQKEHFNEHYMESAKFPNSTYTGKILNFENCSSKCKLNVISKGKLTIHGVTKVVTIPTTITIEKNNYEIDADFKVVLSDFGIEIPLILEGKISPVINVSVSAKFPDNEL